MKRRAKNTEIVYGMGARFASPKALMEAAEKARDKGFRRWDVHSPFPIHGMDAAMGLGNSRVSAVSLAGGVTGFLTALILIFYSSGIDYPLIVQGKPYFAFEPTFPIFFELTILLTAFGTIGGMLVFNRLPAWYHPAFNWDLFSERVNDDGFFIIIQSRDPLFAEKETKEFLESLGGTDVTLIKEEA
ncbi:MAG: DUF3341 domain-containing protein [Verrucomicrobiota bacterium]